MLCLVEAGFAIKLEGEFAHAVEQTTCGGLFLGYGFLKTVGSTLIKTINPMRIWVDKGWSFICGLKNNLPHPAFPSHSLPVAGGKPGLPYVNSIVI